MPACYPPPHPACLQVFYVTTVVATSWPPGERRTFYLYAVPAALATTTAHCIPFRADQRSIACVSVVSQSGVERWRVAVTLVNGGTKAVPMGWAVRLGVQVGPR